VVTRVSWEARAAIARLAGSPGGAANAHLSPPGGRAYIRRMTRPASTQTLLAIALAAILLAAATGVAFAGWLNHGAGIFMSLVEAGIAWCF